MLTKPVAENKIRIIVPVLFTLLALLALGNPAYSYSTAVVTGVITDVETGDPIAGANVRIEGTSIGTATDLNGHFHLSQVPKNEFRLLVSFVGYESKAVDVELGDTLACEVEVMLEDSPFEMKTVVVTGTRSARYLEDAPVRTEVISSRDLKMRSAANLYEALEFTAGVRVESQCQACNFTMVRMNGLGADHTQIMMDGQPVYSGLASVYGLQQFSTAEIDRIEIVKGAGSALYGPNAIAGVVNIITERPTKQHLEAGVEVGEHGTNQFDASAEFVKDNSAYSIFTQINSEEAIDITGDGYSRYEVYEADGITDRVESGARNVGANAFFSNMLMPEDEISIRFRFMDEKRMGGETANDAYMNPYTVGTEHITTDRLTGTLGYLAQLSDVNSVDVTFSVVSHSRNATNDTYLGDYMDTHDGETPDISDLRPYMAEEQMFVVGGKYNHVLGKHYLTLGLQYSYDELDETGRYVIVEEDDEMYGFDYTSSSNKHAHDFGAYVQDEWHLSHQWEIVYGVRGDIHNSEDIFSAEEQAFSQVYETTTYDETSFSPRMALKWAPSSDWTYRTSYGTGFRVPYGFSEDLHLCSGSPRVWKGPSLVPEKSQSVNFSVDYARSDITVGVNVYTTQLYGAIGIVNANDEVRAKGYHYEYENIDEAMVYGVDVSASWQIIRRLRVGGDLSWFHGEYDNIRDDWAATDYEEDSKYISRFPSLSGGVRVDWIPGNWEATFNVRYTGNMYIDYAEEDDLQNAGSMVFETDPFVLFNAQVSYKFDGQYRVYLGARNIGDYVQPVKHVDDAAFYYAPVYGRLIYTGIRVEL